MKKSQISIIEAVKAPKAPKKIKVVSRSGTIRHRRTKVTDKAISSPPHYLVNIWFDKVDGCYIAEVPALQGCMSHGATFIDAAKNINEAMNLWLEDAGTHGDAIPEPDIVSEQLRSLLPVISVSKLARKAGINGSTLASKLRRHSRLSDEESAGIRSALQMTR